MAREYWNYSTDHCPTQPESLPSDLNDLHRTWESAVRAAKAFCRAAGLEYDDQMIGQVLPDALDELDGRRDTADLDAVPYGC